MQCFKNIANFILAVYRMASLSWRAYPWGFVGVITMEIFQGALPLANAWLIKTILDSLVLNFQRESSAILSRQLMLLLAAQIGLNVVNQMLIPLAQALTAELSRRLAFNVQTNIYQKISSFQGLQPFEDPQLYDTINLALHGAQFGPQQTLTILTSLLQSTITLVGFLSLLVAFNPLLAVIVALAMLPQLYAQLRMGGHRFARAYGDTPRERRAQYYTWTLAGAESAKEVRLFNLAEYFLSLFRQITATIHQSQREQINKELHWQVGLSILSSVVAAGAFIIVVLEALAARLSLGDVTLYLSAVTMVQSTLAHLVFSVGGLYEGVLFYRRYTDLLAMPQPLPLVTTPQPVPALTYGIEFRNVSFRYSAEQPWVLRHVNLFIPAGQCIALVGLNGAGKTTLVKLLTRLYDPTEGQVLWDGIDIRLFDPLDLRRHLGAIFQDFVRFDLTAHQNIALGDTTHHADRIRVRQAASQAGIHAVIERLPCGYDTLISLWLTDDEHTPGAELSGGEWQKVALARMFMREADLLILDEPTAALDAQAEYDLYHRFRTLLAGRSSLLISHRFSTVQMADAVAVLANGQIVEYGPHAKLVAQGGAYAELYAKQATLYQTARDSSLTAIFEGS